jgi:murein tripeptide amidase MpaA
LAVAGGGWARQTPFEESGGTATPRYDQTMAWLEALAAGSPMLQVTDFGVSPQGRKLPLVIADLEGRFTPAAPESRTGRVVLLVQACIHAGESCGKDAGMLLLRDMAEDPALAAALLERVTILFIPIFNVDGHERFGPYGRINQNGPQEMGWRTTARNLNLNRDFLKADAPEMRAWLALWNRWSPDFLIDIHSTDGADYQYAVTYSLETHGNMEAGLTGLTRGFEDEMTSRMAAEGWPMIPYVSFRDWHDPRSGLEAWAAGPRYSQGYAAVRNRPGLLIETHMLKDYRTRVAGTGRLIRNTLAWLNGHAADLRQTVTAADAFTASAAFRAEPFALDFEGTEEARTIDFQGISYETLMGAVTGGSWSRFTGSPETMQLPYYDHLVPSVTVSLPEAYLIPPQWQETIDRLQRHGVRMRRLAAPVELDVRTYRFGEAAWQSQPSEGRHPVTFTAQSIRERCLFPAGTAVVDMNQPAARAAAHLLEPQGPDSLVRWGFFDAVFERVEYVESYVIEQMIPQMLAADPRLGAELDSLKAGDPKFAADPWAIRHWFYARTPYYDDRVGVYPVGLVDDADVVATLPLD